MRRALPRRQRGFMFTPLPFTTPQRLINITSSADNVNVYTLAGSPTSPVRIKVVIAAGVQIGSTSTGSYAFVFGTGWHANATVRVENHGTIMGKGGAGGNGGGGGGSTGGPAINAAAFDGASINFDNQGTIAGGGGGGAGGATRSCSGKASYTAPGGGGGGGRGRTNTGGGSPAGGNCSAGGGGTGTASSAGGGGSGCTVSSQGDCGFNITGGNGGSGGGFGSAGGSGGAGTNGSSSGAGSGGGGGTAVNGDSEISWVNLGTINGARVG